jgi:hypothetical protein
LTVNESIADAADGERNRKLRQPRNHVCVTVLPHGDRSATLGDARCRERVLNEAEMEDQPRNGGNVPQARENAADTSALMPRHN